MNIFSLGAPSWFVEAINSLWLSICQVLFIFINFLYRVFVKVASVNLFSTEVFEKITGNLYVVMGIAMLFIFAYNLIFMIIDPDDKKSTGRTSKIVKETIISLTVIVLLPTIFINLAPSKHFLYSLSKFNFSNNMLILLSILPPH